jgi:hypothetical protein
MIKKMNSDKKFEAGKNILIFVHIPKCGGTTLHSLLNTALNGNYYHFYPENKLPLNIQSLSGGGGHQPFGSTPLHTQDEKDVFYITLMREPLSRLLSLYKHIIRNRHHNLHPMASKYRFPRDFFKCAHESGVEQVSNHQVKMICGRNCSPLFNNALVRIEESFKIVGCLENYEVFIRDLNSYLGSNITEPKKLNQSPASQSLSFGSAAIDYLTNINSEDIKLYDFLFKNIK